MKVLFLDIDGVLNGHDFNEGAQSNTIRQSCIKALNLILARSKPKVVLSSAWRYMVHCKAITTTGFEYLLRTHGACGIVGQIVGVTIADELCGHCGYDNGKSCREFKNGYLHCAKCDMPNHRGRQITQWLNANSNGGIESYCVLDDENYEIMAMGHPLVMTNGATGLTMRKAHQVVKILGKAAKI